MPSAKKSTISRRQIEPKKVSARSAASAVASRAAGYSGTPLPQKLGIKVGSTVHVVGAPAGYSKLLTPLPEGVKIGSKMSAATDVIQVFATDKARLQNMVAALRQQMRPD